MRNTIVFHLLMKLKFMYMGPENKLELYG